MSSNDYLKANFEKSTMALKGAITTIVSVLVLYVAHGFQTGDWTPTQNVWDIVSIVGPAVSFGLLVCLRNAIKNYWGIDIGPWFGVVLVGVALQGCAGITPALAGKTNLTTKFSDVVTADGGQNTQYEQTVKAPAGVQLENIASMGYKWNPDGSGDIAIASSPKADTTAQADALVQVNAQQMELIGKMMEQIVALAGIASPLVGGKISADAAQGQTDAVNKAALQQGILQALQNPEVLKAIKQATRPKPIKPVATTPEPEPVSPGASLPEN